MSDKHTRYSLLGITASLIFLTKMTPYAFAGAFVSGDDIIFFYDYLAEGADLEANVCILPDTQNAQEMVVPVQHAVRRWNRLQPSTSNVRPDMLPSNTVDLESVVVHELGHCMGLDHPNVGAVVLGDAVNATAALRGPNNTLDLDAGDDAVFGTADDVRGDDINSFYFRLNNNPFSIAPIVDSSTYSRDVAKLPAGDLFPANPEQEVGKIARYNVPDSEAVMQHNILVESTQRSLAHDDVAMLRLAAAGLDGIQGTADDYTWRLNYLGITDNEQCDITIAMQPGQGSLGSCFVSSFQTSQRPGKYLSSGEIVLNSDADWYYNTVPPCSESMELPVDEWRMISMPCDIGISSSATLENVLGDDLGIDELGVTWAVFEWEYMMVDGELLGGYRTLTASDELKNGIGYWIQTILPDQVIDVQGQYPAQIDVPLSIESATGEGWNMIGSPFRFETQWADARIIDTNGDRLTLAAADPANSNGGAALTETACTQAVLLDECKVARFAFKYNGSAYEVLSDVSGSLSPFDATWVFAATEGVGLRLTMPAQELVAR